MLCYMHVLCVISQADSPSAGMRGHEDLLAKVRTHHFLPAFSMSCSHSIRENIVGFWRNLTEVDRLFRSNS